MRRRRLMSLLLAATLPLVAAPASAGEAAAPVVSGLPVLAGDYQLSRGSLGLGRASVRFEALGDDCYQYGYTARPTGIARLFIGQIDELSEFCLVNDEVLPRRFSFTRADRAKDNYVLHFDLEKGEARTEDGRVQAFEGPVIDRLAMQLQVQRWVMRQKGEPSAVEYPVTKVEDDRVRTYRFRIVQRETLTQAGQPVETVRVDRVDDPRKSIRFWVAPAEGWRVVKVEHVDKGSQQFQMELVR